MPHSEKTKERLRELGLANKQKFAEFSALGPMAQARKVVCLDDGMIHASISSAASHYGVDTGTITKVCQRKRAAVKDLVFRYYGDHLGGSVEAQSSRDRRTRSNKRLVAIGPVAGEASYV